MADNSTLPATGDAIRDKDRSGVKTQIVGIDVGIGTGTEALMSSTNPMPVISPSVVSTANSTTSVLAGAAVFTGTPEDVSNFAAIVVSVLTSHASATDGFSLQQSPDGTNWDVLDTYTMPAMAAGGGFTFQVQPALKFFRLVYTNGATLQTTFRLQTIYHYAAPTPSSVRAGDTTTNERDLTQTQDFPMVFNGTTWDRMRGDITNGLDVDVTRLPALVAGSAVIGALTANQSVNNAQIAGVAVSAGNGISGTGVQRVTIASDSTGVITLAGTPATTLAGVAEDAALSGNALRQGLRAHSGVPTAMSADNDIVTPWADRSGAQAIIPQPRQTFVQVVPTITTTAYTSGDQIGGVMTVAAALASGRAGQITGLTVFDKSNLNIALEVYVFLLTPTSPAGDNAPAAISDANAATAIPIGVFDVLAANYRIHGAASGFSVGMGTLVGGAPLLPFVTSGSVNLFALAVVRGTPTYAVGDLTFNFTLNQF